MRVPCVILFDVLLATTERVSGRRPPRRVSRALVHGRPRAARWSRAATPEQGRSQERAWSRAGVENLVAPGDPPASGPGRPPRPCRGVPSCRWGRWGEGRPSVLAAGRGAIRDHRRWSCWPRWRGGPATKELWKKACIGRFRALGEEKDEGKIGSHICWPNRCRQLKEKRVGLTKVDNLLETFFLACTTQIYMIGRMFS
jgi:hypothetical protein